MGICCYAFDQHWILFPSMWHLPRLSQGRTQRIGWLQKLHDARSVGDPIAILYSFLFLLVRIGAMAIAIAPLATPMLSRHSKDPGIVKFLSLVSCFSPASVTKQKLRPFFLSWPESKLRGKYLLSDLLSYIPSGHTFSPSLRVPVTLLLCTSYYFIWSNFPILVNYT